MVEKEKKNLLLGNFKQMNYLKHLTQPKICFPEEKKKNFKNAVSLFTWKQLSQIENSLNYSGELLVHNKNISPLMDSLHAHHQIVKKISILLV